MRKLSLAWVAAMLLTTSTFLANDNTKVAPTESLSLQISKMLADNSFSEMELDLTGQIRFTLNSKGEIVVLSVDTPFKNLERFVKGKLNYQKVDLENVEEGKIYTVPVTIKAQ